MRFALLISALICVGCVRDRGPGPDDQRAKLLPFGVVDVPSAGQQVAGTVTLGGWAIHEAGIRSVEIFVDRKHAADGTASSDRPDVVAAYPEFQRQMISGWSGLIDSTQLLSGPHDLVVRIYAKNGATRDLPGSFVVANPK